MDTTNGTEFQLASEKCGSFDGPRKINECRKKQTQIMKTQKNHGKQHF